MSEKNILLSVKKENTNTKNYIKKDKKGIIYRNDRSEIIEITKMRVTGLEPARSPTRT